MNFWTIVESVSRDYSYANIHETRIKIEGLKLRERKILFWLTLSVLGFWFLADMEKVSSSLAVLAEKSRKKA